LPIGALLHPIEVAAAGLDLLQGFDREDRRSIDRAAPFRPVLLPEGLEMGVGNRRQASRAHVLAVLRYAARQRALLEVAETTKASNRYWVSTHIERVR
jgi:hypothetical protein